MSYRKHRTFLHPAHSCPTPIPSFSAKSRRMHPKIFEDAYTIKLIISLSLGKLNVIKLLQYSILKLFVIM